MGQRLLASAGVLTSRDLVLLLNNNEIAMARKRPAEPEDTLLRTSNLRVKKLQLLLLFVPSHSTLHRNHRGPFAQRNQRNLRGCTQSERQSPVPRAGMHVEQGIILFI